MRTEKSHESKRHSRKVFLISPLFMFCLVFIFLFSSCGKQAEKKDLFMITQNGKMGYMDKEGKVVIEPQFDQVGGFSDGLSPAAIGDKWGYIDEKGNFVINPQFSSADPFTDGVASVEIDGKHTGERKPDKWGLIDKAGKYIISPQFRNAIQFEENVALISVCNDNDLCKWGFIDRSGRYVIEPQFERAFYFSEGLAVVMNEDELWGFIDKKGKFVIPPQFYEASPFHEGLAIVQLENKQVGYIDKQGNFVIKPQFDYATDFSDGFASVQVGGKWGLIDKTGKFVVNPKFMGPIQRFSEGLAAVQGENEQYVYIDKTGKLVIKLKQPPFVFNFSFHGGLAKVFVGNLREGFKDFGFINKNGDMVIKPQFIEQSSCLNESRHIYPSSEFFRGLAWVCVRKVDNSCKCGYIDKSGKYIWGPSAI